MKYFLQEKLPDDSRQPIIIPITSPECIIGRISTRELRNHFMVSRTHALFNVTNRGTLCVKDLNSTFGLFVNGLRVDKSILYQLDIGDMIGFGTLDNSKNQGFVCVVCCDQPMTKVKQEMITFSKENCFKYSLEKQVKLEKFTLDCVTQKDDLPVSTVPYTPVSLDMSKLQNFESVAFNSGADVPLSAKTNAINKMCQTDLNQLMISKSCLQEAHLCEHISEEPIHSGKFVLAKCDGRQNSDDISDVISNDVRCAMSVQFSAFLEKPITSFKARNANQQHMSKLNDDTMAFEKNHVFATKDHCFQNENLPSDSEDYIFNACDSSENSMNPQNFSSQELDPFPLSVIGEPVSQVDTSDVGEYSEKCNSASEVYKVKDTCLENFTCHVLLTRYDPRDLKYVCNEKDSDEINAIEVNPQKKRRKKKYVFSTPSKKVKSVAANRDGAGNENTLSQTICNIKPCYVALTKLDYKHLVSPTNTKCNSKSLRKKNSTYSCHQKRSRSKRGKRTTK